MEWWGCGLFSKTVEIVATFKTLVPGAKTVNCQGGPRANGVNGMSGGKEAWSVNFPNRSILIWCGEWPKRSYWSK